MIGLIKGSVAYLTTEYCLLETAGGVGYMVFMPTSQLSQLTVGSNTTVFTHTSVREDAIQLYGFIDQSYYELFMMLTGVSGIGPKSANQVLSAIKPEAFYLAVQSRDLKVLTGLPGIGRKTAERLILELKDKVGSVSASPGVDRPGNGTMITEEMTGSVAEAIQALNALGYTNSEIMPVLHKISGYHNMSSKDIIRGALKIFSQR